MKRVFLLISLFSFFLLISACQAKKSYDEMTNEEKVAVVVAGEDELSPDELRRQHEVRANILKTMDNGNKAEKELQEALADAKNLLDDDEIAKLDAAQDLWMRQGRGVEMNALIQTGMDAKRAYAKVSENRASKIREQLNRAVLIAAPKLYQGYFRASLGQSLEIYQLDENVIVVTMRLTEPQMVINTKGQYHGNTREPVKLISEKESDIAFELKWIDKDQLELMPDPAVAASPTFAPYVAPLTARYIRVKKEDLNVFSF